MQKPYEFYTSEKDELTLKASSLKNKLSLSSTVRLFTFLGIILGLYLFFGNAIAMFIVAVIGFGIFIYLVLFLGVNKIDDDCFWGKVCKRNRMVYH